LVSRCVCDILRRRRQIYRENENNGWWINERERERERRKKKEEFTTFVICSPSLSLSLSKKTKLWGSVPLRYAPCNTLSLPPILSAERTKRVSLRDFVFVSSSLGTKAIALSFAIADQRQQRPQFEFFALLLILSSLSSSSYYYYRFPYLLLLQCCCYLLLLFAWSTRSGLTHLRELAFVPALVSN